MRSVSRGQLHRRASQLGLVSVAALMLSACSSDADRLSFFGVDQGQPMAAQPVYVQPQVMQPQMVQQQQVAQLPTVTPGYAGPQTVSPTAAGLPTPAPYTAPTYVAPGYTQPTASIARQPVQMAGQPVRQPLPQPIMQPISQPVQRSGTPTAQLARLPGGLVGGGQQVVQQQIVQQPVYQAPVYQAPQQMVQPIQQAAPQVQQLPQPLITASIPTAPQLPAASPLQAPQVNLAPQASVAPQQLPAQLPNQINRDAGWSAVGGTRVQVQPGETLFSMSRRFGIPVDVLQRANGLSDANAVRAGQTIIVPVYSTASAATAVAPAQAAPASLGVDTTLTGSTSTAPTAGQQRVAVPAPTPRPRSLPIAAQQQPQLPNVAQATAPVAQTVAPAAASGTHTVAQGDTVYSIARRYGMSVQQLTSANNIANVNAIRIGQRLVVGGAAPGLPVANASQTPTQTVGQTPAQTVAARAYTPPQPASEVAPSVEQTAAAREVAARNDAIAEQTPLQFRWPIRGRVLSEFGTLPSGIRNDGINIAVPEGASIRAAEDGEVVYAGNELRGFGNLVLVQHRSGYVTAYAHNSRISVQRGDRVSRGEIIARAGSTGDVDTPQLHFEIRRGTTPVDPSPYLPQG